MKPTSRLTKIGLAGAGVVAGAVLAGTIGAQAATPSPSPSSSTAATTNDAHPGDNGVPEAQEQQGGHGRGLDLSGTVAAVGSSTVTIKMGTGSTVYTVTSSSDIDKNGEASLSALAAGDAVTFSVDGANTKQIDKLHAGDEAKNRPPGAPSPPPSSSTGA